MGYMKGHELNLECSKQFCLSYMNITQTEECANAYLGSVFFMIHASDSSINYAISLISAEK